MPKHLTDQQLESYRREGAVGRCDFGGEWPQVTE